MKITEKNGYKISELTLGTVQLGIPYGINNTNGLPSYEESAEILQTAIQGGIVSFDTAKGYGKSEEVLGRFFAENEAEKTLITKVEFEKETHAEVKDSLFSKVKDSMKVMGLSQIPLVLLHSESYLNTYGQTMLDAILELKKEGLVKSAGISFSNKDQLMQFTDPEIFDSIQIPANMFDNAEIVSGTMKKLSDMGVSVYVRSVYLQGLFFKDPSSLPLKIQSAKPALEKLHKLAADNGISMAELAMSYMRSVDGVASLVIGCETADQLKNNLALFDMPLLSKSVTDKIAEIAEEIEPVVIKPWEWNK